MEIQLMTVDLRIHGVGQYELLQDVSVQVNGWHITVYKGFKWDGASIPKFLWDRVGCPLDYALESLIHDALYRSNALPRKLSDKIFYELLIRGHIIAVKAKAMYLGVRLGGSSAYSNTPNKPRDKAFVRVTFKGGTASVEDN
jgi:hypothetical protein